MPCFSKGCRDAATHSPKPLGGGGAFPPTDQPRRRDYPQPAHGPVITDPTLSSPIISGKAQDEERPAINYEK